jgi:hypothetical protein
MYITWKIAATKQNDKRTIKNKMILVKNCHFVLKINLTMGDLQTFKFTVHNYMKIKRKYLKRISLFLIYKSLHYYWFYLRNDIPRADNQPIPASFAFFYAIIHTKMISVWQKPFEIYLVYCCLLPTLLLWFP